MGGNRVIAQFLIKPDKPNAFVEATDKFSGTLVFNSRGGCLFIKNGLNNNAKSRMFRTDDTIHIQGLQLSEDDKTIALLTDFNVTLLGEKSKGSDIGIIVKFTNFSESQIEEINLLLEKLPKVSSDSELFLDDESDAA